MTALRRAGYERDPRPARGDRGSWRRAGRRRCVRLGRPHECRRCARAPPPDARHPGTCRCHRQRNGASVRRAWTSSRPSRPRRGFFPCSPPTRAVFCSPGRKAPAVCSRMRWEPTSSCSTERCRSCRPSGRGPTSSCSPRRPRPRAYAALGRMIPAVSIGPQTTRAAVGERHRRPRRGGDARRRRSRGRGPAGARDVVDSTRGHLLPDRFRAAGRLRRHVPRRDHAHRARRPCDRRDARDPADSGAPGCARAVQHASRTCRSGSTWRSSIRVWVGSRRPLVIADTGGASVRRSRQRAPPSRRRAGRDRGGPRACEPGLRAREHLAHLPRTRPVRSGRRAPRERRPARGARPASPSGRPRATRPAEALVRGRSHRRHHALRRQLREHRAQPDARRRGERGCRSRLADRARAGRRALLRRDGPHVRGRQAGGRDSLRGQLPEHVRRDQPRQRGLDAPRRPGRADSHPGARTQAWRRSEGPSRTLSLREWTGRGRLRRARPRSPRCRSRGRGSGSPRRARASRRRPTPRDPRRRGAPPGR